MRPDGRYTGTRCREDGVSVGARQGRWNPREVLRDGEQEVTELRVDTKFRAKTLVKESFEKTWEGGGTLGEQEMRVL